MRIRCHPVFAAVLFALAATPLLAAQMPQINSTIPDFIQRGTEIEMALSGEALDSVVRVDIHGGEGLEATLVPDATPVEKRDKKTVGKNLKLKLRAAANARAGDRELRLIAPTGVSNPITINVGLYPVIVEKEPNNTAEQAQKITLPAVLSGAIDGGGDVDMFRFAAKKGETIVFEVQASRFGSKLDSSLRVLDLNGKVLAHDEDTNDLDSLIAFHAPNDGDYLLQIRDLRYGGGKEFTYRIVAGHTPYIESVFPPGGRRGTTVEVEPRGWNLDGISKMQIKIDASQKIGVMPIRAESAAGMSNDVPFDVGDVPEVNESEPNNAPANANPVTPPVVINGRIGEPKDADYFRFPAKKGQRLAFKIASARIASPLDPQITLYNAKGEFLQEDSASGEVVRAFDADGEYVVGVRDLAEHGGAAYQYRLSIQEPIPTPNFSVKFVPDRVQLHRGGRTKLWCDVIRDAGFNADITLAFENLPKGISADPYVSSAKTPNSGLLLLSAADDADLGAFALQLRAVSKISGSEVSREAEALLNKNTVRSAYVATLAAAPFTVSPGKELSQEERARYAAERAELEKTINAQTPELDAAQAKWEAEAAKSAWTVLDALEFHAKSGAVLTKQEDGSLLATGREDAKDMYSVIARTTLTGITAIRLEAMSDASLPDQGPGRATNGNFVLTDFAMRAAVGADAKVALAAAPAKFIDATSDFAQSSFPAQGAIDGSKTGWAVSPEFGKSHYALFDLEKPLAETGAKTLAFELDFNSQYPQHIIGRFRLSATTSAKPAAGSLALPDAIREIILTEKEKRSDEQKKKLAAFYRTISPELSAQREHLAQLTQLESGTHAYPPVAVRNAATTLNVEVARAPGFKGEIKLTLAGFNTGSKEGDEQPASINLDITPATLRGDQKHGAIVIKPKGNCPFGTRDIVILAESKVGDETVIQASERIPLTVKEKK